MLEQIEQLESVCGAGVKKFLEGSIWKDTVTFCLEKAVTY